MFENEFNTLLNSFAVPVKLNDEEETRKAIISNQPVNESLPNFDDKKVTTNFPLKRGDIILYENTQYLVINDIQNERPCGFKAIMRPMTNVFTYTYMTEGVFERDRFGNKIWIIEPEEIIVELPCIAYQESSPTIEGGYIRQPEERIIVIMSDNDTTELIELGSEHSLLNANYEVININLLQHGLRIFTMKWTAS